MFFLRAVSQRNIAQEQRNTASTAYKSATQISQHNIVRHFTRVSLVLSLSLSVNSQVSGDIKYDRRDFKSCVLL